MATSAVARRKPVAVDSSSGITAANNGNVAGSSGLDIEKILAGDYDVTGTAKAQADVHTKDVVKNVRLRQQANELADQATSIEAMSPEEKLKAKEEILAAKIEEMRQSLPGDQRALGALISTLNSSFQDLKEGFAQVAEFNPEEQKVLERAKNATEDAATALTEAEEGLEKARGRTKWFGFRERAVASAETALANAQSAIQAAKSGEEVATATAQKMRDERLQASDFEQSFKFIEACVEQTKKAIAERIVQLNAQSAEAQTEKITSFNRKEEAARKMEGFQVQVDELAARFQQESESRDQLPAGSSERVKADQKVSQTQREYEEAKAKHDQELAVYQEMEKAIIALEIQETSLRVGLHAHKVELARLHAGSNAWVVEARNRLAEIKSLASQQASKDLIEVNVAVRKDNVRNSAAFAIASLRLITEQAEKHPTEMAELDVYGQSMRDGLQEFAGRWAAVEEKRKAAAGGSPSDS